MNGEAIRSNALRMSVVLGKGERRTWPQDLKSLSCNNSLQV